MKILIHDVHEQDAEAIINKKENLVIYSKNKPIKPCIGCFGCWIKTPGTCVIKDGYENLGENLSKARELIIISRLTYGGFSPFVKNVLDRTISYVLPYFRILEGEMHHEQRYDNKYRVKVIFYGEYLEQEEMDLAYEVVKAVGVNFNFEKFEVDFIKDIQELKVV